ncbi:hypothetical protein B0H14DRAFT_2746942 [Mycena olivaceomarginata]|nr:hypothetical protein B0H14DRAFT_2746942 [Mycena olivaceomarginata]
MAFPKNSGDSINVQDNINLGSPGCHSTNRAYNVNPGVARGPARGGMSNATTIRRNNPAPPNNTHSQRWYPPQSQNLRGSISLPVLQTSHRSLDGYAALPLTHPCDTDPAPSTAQINLVAPVPSFFDPFEPPAQRGPGIHPSRAIPIPRPNLYRRGSQSDDGICSSTDASSSSSSRPPSSLSFYSSSVAQRAPGGSRRRGGLGRGARSSSDSEDAGMDTSGNSTAGSVKTATYSPLDEKSETAGGSWQHNRAGSDLGDTGFGETLKTGTFFIYSPHDDRPETPVDSFTIQDSAFIQANLGAEGCLVSVHEPTEAASWTEDNLNDPVLTSIRNSGCGGPFAWMLSPTKPALAIFGSYNEPVVVNMAQTLAHSSGFPVVIRPPSDNPALTLLTRNTVPPYFRSPDTGRDERRSNLNDSREGETEVEDERSTEEPGGGAEPNGHVLNSAEEQQPLDGGSQGSGGEGGGGAGEPTTVDGKWEGPLHSTRVKLRLKPHRDTARTCAVTIGYTYKFLVNRDSNIPIDLDNLSHALSQPEVLALVDLKIETRKRETQVDRSYANIGFLAHRKNSINDRQFFSRGFDQPDRILKRGQQRQSQRGFQGVVGFSHGPVGTAAMSDNRTNGTTLEGTDTKALPKYRVLSEPGDEWDKDNKSYSSYDIVYEAQDIPLGDEQPDAHPLEVKVGMGINLRPAGSKKPLPQISFVNRNQVLIWVSDPTSKAPIRGILVLMSSYLDNIRTEEELSIYEQGEIQLGTEPLNDSKFESEEHEPGTVSLSVAQVEKHDTPGSNKFLATIPNFITKRGRGSSVSNLTDIPAHEYQARGWDVDNEEWRSVLWPALDKDFLAAEREKSAAVWKIQCPWDKAPQR